MRLIAIGGKAGSGKTTFADHMLRCFGGTKLSFATAVKEEVADFLNQCGAAYEQRHLYGSTEDKAEILKVPVENWIESDYRPRAVLNKYITQLGNELCISYRQLMQVWGTEYRRTQNPNYWEEKMRWNLEDSQGLVCIDDVRFPNEVKLCADFDGLLVRVARPGLAESDHPSETALDDFKEWSLTMMNYGSLEEYLSEIQRVGRWLV